MRLAALLIALALPPALPLSAQTPDAKAPTGDWRVTLLGDTATLAEDEVTLHFDATQISGRAGCNRFSAALLTDPVFGFGPMAMTRMLCHGRAAELEDAFGQQIVAVDGWRLDGEVLELLAGEEVVLRAERPQAP